MLDVKKLIAKLITSTSTKSATASITAPAYDIGTASVTANNSTYKMVKGFAVTNTQHLAIMQCYFSNANTITVRVRNTAASQQSGSVTVYYC